MQTIFIKIDASIELPPVGKRVTCYSIEYTHDANVPIYARVDSSGQWLEVDDLTGDQAYMESKVDYWLKEITIKELLNLNFTTVWDGR